MSSKQDAALRLGMGTVKQVSIALADLSPDERELSDAIHSLGRMVSVIQGVEGGDSILTRLFCAIANGSLLQTGKLYRVDNSGEIATSYYSKGEERDAIAMLIGIS